MSVSEMPGEVAELAMTPGERLIHRRDLMDRGEAAWLAELAAFDLDELWLLDEQFRCVDWLMMKLHMSRATAFEKLRIAHALRRRPVVAEAFAAGDISYSSARLITRLIDPDPEVDEALVDLAQSGRFCDLENAVRRYRLLAGQERLPNSERRGLRLSQDEDGLGIGHLVLEATEMDEVRSTLQAFMDHAAAQPDATASDDPEVADESVESVEKPVEESTVGDSAAPLPVSFIPLRRRLADAFMDMIRTASAALGEGFASGAERYMVHIVVDAASGTATRLDGTPLDPIEAERVACDSSTVIHVQGSAGEPLRLGRKSREWNTAQQRAVRVRDGGRCRFPGCWRKLGDIHHLRWWTRGGPTDINNGLYLCAHHHTMIHRGFTATGDANGAVAFARPDGTSIGITTPVPRRLQARSISGEAAASDA
jgi:hypothetical protein